MKQGTGLQTISGHLRLFLEPGGLHPALTPVVPKFRLRNPARRWTLRGIFPLAILALVVLAGMIVPGLLLLRHVALDYGEGWNAYWSHVAATTPGQLYPDGGAMVSNNYPPAYFLLVGSIGQLTGDVLLTGRGVAAASLALSAVLGGACVWRVSRSASAAVGCGLLILLYATYVFNRFLFVNNPQWLAEALILMALYPLLGSGPADRRSLGLAALGVTAAMLVKHNMVALPLAIALWLGLTDRAALGRWIGRGASLCAAVAALGYALWGPAIFTQIFLFDRTISLSGGRDGLVDAALTLPLVIAAAVLVRRIGLRGPFGLLVIYAGLATALGVAQRFGTGVCDNAQFEGLCALLVLACSALGRRANGRLWHLGPQAFERWVAFMTVPGLVGCAPVLAQRWEQWQSRRVTEAGFARIVADVRVARGSVLCENLAVCYWAGRPMGLDFFAYGQKLRRGNGSGAVKGLFDAREPDIVVEDLGFPSKGEQRLPGDVTAAIARGYRVRSSVPGVVAELVRR